MVALERLTNCPYCGSVAFTPGVPCDDRFHGLVADLEYTRCSDCGVVFLLTRVKESDIAELYPEAYEPYQAARPAISSSRSRLRESVARAVIGGFRRLPDKLAQVTAAHYTPPRPGARFVDFGCGSSAFLERAAAQNWAPIGVDFVPSVVNRVRQAGYECYLVDECWEKLGEGSVEALRLNHVLEHLYDPLDTMDRLRRLLAVGGRLHIAIPNPEGLGAMLFRRDWRSFEPRHIMLYGPGQARSLLDRLGFRDIRIVHEFLSKDMARSWGYRRARLERMEHRHVEGLAEQVDLNALLTPVAKMAALLERADRFHIFAKR